MGGNFSLNSKNWLENAGLEEVHERLVDITYGAKAKPEIVAKSINGTCGAVPAWVAVAKSKFSSSLM